MHLGPPVLDKVERSWSCWRHPNASGVGVNVACAMGNTRFSQAPGDFLEGGCGRVSWDYTTNHHVDHTSVQSTTALNCQFNCRQQRKGVSRTTKRTRTYVW